MISASMPPVFRGLRTMATGEYFEAFAMTYWAGYNDQAVSARVLQSMQRAWSVQAVKMIPRVPDVRPGMCVAKIGPTPTDYRLVVATEGMASIRQILGNVGSLDPVSPSNQDGKVVKAFSQAANACREVVAFDDFCRPDFENPARSITFCGHSQGAACADIMAAQQRDLKPTQDLRVIKFAAPRVGNGGWVFRRHPATKIMHFFTVGDLIHGLPQGNYGIVVPGVLGVRFTQVAWYRAEPVYRMLNPMGLLVGGGGPSTSDTPALAALARYTHGPSPDNPWYPHVIDYYRMCMTAWAAESNDEFAYRMRWMEFEDDNQFGTVWAPGHTVFPVHTVSVPAPADVTPITVGVPQQVAVPAVEQPRNVVNDPIHEIAAGPGGGGEGDWGDVAPPIQTQFNPQRRRRAVQNP